MRAAHRRRRGEEYVFSDWTSPRRRGAIPSFLTSLAVHSAVVAAMWQVNPRPAIREFQAPTVEQLLAASGKSVTFLTAVCILDPVGRARYEHTDKTVVSFRDFDRRLADAYLRHDEPYDCAGSFKLEGAGFVLFESVQTDDPTALIGLPMIWLAARLHELGYLLP